MRPDGVLVDARPDSRVLAHVLHAGTRVGVIRTALAELRNDAHADHAVATVTRARLLRRVRSGRFWPTMTFASLAELRTYLAEHVRLEHRVRWTPAAKRALRRWRNDSFTIERAIRFAVLAPR